MLQDKHSTKWNRSLVASLVYLANGLRVDTVIDDTLDRLDPITLSMILQKNESGFILTASHNDHTLSA